MKHVAILGAGVCGLAAAWELLRSGAAEKVTLLEADERPGGLAKSVYDPSGLVSDLGPHRIHTEIPEIESLLNELVDPEDMLWVDRKSAMFIGGKFVDYPFSIGGVIGAFGPFEFLRMGMSAALAKVTSLGKGRASNYDEHMRRSFGSRVYERVLGPYSEKLWKCSPTEISVEAAEVRVSAGSVTKMAKRLLTGGREKKGEETALKRFRYLRGGVESLVKRLVNKAVGAGAEIQCKTTVGKLTRTEEGWLISHSRGDLAASHLISTIPINILPRMIEGSEPPKEHLKALEYLGIALVFLVINKERTSDNHWLYFPGPEVCFNRGYEPTRFWRDESSPRDQTLLCLEVTGRHRDPLWQESDDSLTSRVVSDLEKTGLISAELVEKSLVVRLPHGYPVYDCASDDHLREIFAHLQQCPGLITTGRQGLFSHNNMDHSMHMGLEAARALAQGPEGIRAWYERADSLRHQRIVD